MGTFWLSSYPGQEGREREVNSINNNYWLGLAQLRWCNQLTSLSVLSVPPSSLKYSNSNQT